MSTIPDLVGKRHCPKCAGLEVRRSPRKGFFELVLLSTISLRPFRCQGCGARFYGFTLARRAAARGYRDLGPDIRTALPILVYGYRVDKQPFYEETEAQLVSMFSAVLSLTTAVEPGQKLMLLTSEEEQRCRVTVVTKQDTGRNRIEVRFSRPAWEFWTSAESYSPERQ